MTSEESPPDPLFEPRRRAFTDPLGRHLPALERCAIRHRSLQMVLILFHAEELKRDVLAGVDAQKHWRRSVGSEPIAEAEEPLKAERDRALSR